MIYTLEGIVVEKSPLFLILNVNGVGYGINVSRKCEDYVLKDEKYTFFIDMQVREDSITLYGFLSGSDKNAFKTLNSVQGVGGKAALNILSILSVSELYDAIYTENKTLITQADGIGPKIASRIITELSQKISKIIDTTKKDLKTNITDESSSKSIEATQALVSLGYIKADSHNAVLNFTKNNPNANIEDIIKGSLKIISSN